MKYPRAGKIIAWLAVAFFGAEAALFKLRAGLNGPIRITDLDRDGVINADALKAHYPDLAVNLRHNLGIFVTQDLASSGMFIALAAFAFSLAAALYLTFGQTKRIDRGTRKNVGSSPTN